MSVFTEIRRAAAENPGAPIAVDTETTDMNTLWRGLACRGVSLAIGEQSWYLPLTHPHSESENLDPRLVRHLLLELAGQRRRWVWFNAKYDWSVLETLGLDAAAPADQWDTSIGRWLEDENREIRDLKGLAAWLWPEDAPAAERDEMRKLCAGPTLKALEDEHFYGPEGRREGVRRPMGITRAEARERAVQDPRYGAREMWDLTAAEMAPYAAQDAALTLRLYHYQRSLDHRHPIGDAMPREMAVARVLLGMERTGIRVDEGRANAAFAAATTRLKELEDLFEGTNLNAPHQVAELVYDRWGFDCPHLTEAGNKSVDRDALELLGDDPRIVSLLECRRLLKAISGYYKPLIHFLDDRGRIHPTFNQAKVRTGRFSCERPNTQTIPREDTIDEVRKIFVPDAGYELWEYDLSQAELRVSAALAGEERMISAFSEGRDVYQEVADEIWCAKASCAKRAGRCATHRQKAKAVVLAYSYGQKERGLAASLLKGTGQAVTPAHVAQAAAIQYRFGRMYPRLVAAQDRFADIARRDGRIPLPPKGRYRHFRGAGHAPENYKDAANSAAQGGVGEYVKTIMVEAHNSGLWERYGARLLLQVHDSLAAEVPPGEGERLGKELQEIASDHNYWKTVPQVIEAKRWSA
jgi:DNA polymerase I-like protein with 3'-5' exonuclease and polymerase domains